MSGVQFKCTCCGEKGGESGSGESESAESSRVIAFYDKTEWKKVAEMKKLPVIDPELVNYEEFFEEFIVRNLPCMLSSKVTSTWISRQNWVRGEGDQEEINWDYLESIYGNATVSVVSCDSEDEEYGTRECRDMIFKDYVAYWKDLIGSRKDNSRSSSDACLYLKDWHIVRFHQSTGEKNLGNPAALLPYETPVYFRSDFLNESCSLNDSDDFKFCYMGPQGSFTSFHADVYGSYSWSANVFGVKRWLLYPPGKELRFYNEKRRTINFTWDDLGVEGEDYIEVIQDPGECIFVPSGWHHFVWNITDAISINHNWFNGANLVYVWDILQKELRAVEKELADLSAFPDYEDQCQLVLKANHGTNYEEFFKLLQLIKCIRENGNGVDMIEIAPFQRKYDLDAIHHLFQKHLHENALVSSILVPPHRLIEQGRTLSS